MLSLLWRMSRKLIAWLILATIIISVVVLLINYTASLFNSHTNTNDKYTMDAAAKQIFEQREQTKYQEYQDIKALQTQLVAVLDGYKVEAANVTVTIQQAQPREYNVGIGVITNATTDNEAKDIGMRMIHTILQIPFKEPIVDINITVTNAESVPIGTIRYSRATNTYSMETRSENITITS